MSAQKSRIYSENFRKEVVLRILSKEASITEVSIQSGVARKTLYSWVKKYRQASNKSKTNCLRDGYNSGDNHYRYKQKELKNKLLHLVVTQPEISISNYAKKLKKGRHLIYNVLKSLDLTTMDGRLAFCSLYHGPGRLEIQIKESIVKAILAGEICVSDASRENNVSRKTIYDWIKRYQHYKKITHNYTTGENHHKAFSKDQVSQILTKVVQNPEISIHKLSQILPFSSHGIYNVLKSYNLTTKSQRLVYANEHNNIQVSPSFTDMVKSTLEEFIPSRAPAPPPGKVNTSDAFNKIRLVKAFFTSVAASTAFFLFSGHFVKILIDSASLATSIGLIFAFVALIFGGFFFIYSLKYYITLAVVLSYSGENKESFPEKARGLLPWLLGMNGKNSNVGTNKSVGLEQNLEHVKLERHPYISVQIPFFNEKYVAERAIAAACNFDYKGDYEVFVCDDSTDETTQIIESYMKGIKSTKVIKSTKGKGWTLTSVIVRPGVTLKHLHRTTRSGFKGGALKLALTLVDPRCEFISIFDADFVPYPDSLDLFLKYFQEEAGTLDFRSQRSEVRDQKSESGSPKADIRHPKSESNIAAVQGYQWHVLNKSENWITRGVRSEYAGSYIIERSGQEIYGGLKHISGSVYMIRRDVLEEVGWETSITEDYELTLKLYEAGYRVLYTPYIQAPAECVSTLKRLIRQRMRWAEGHSYNVKVMWKRLLFGRWEEINSKSEYLNSKQILNYNLQSSKERGLTHSDLGNSDLFRDSNLDISASKVFVPSPLTFSEKVEFLFNIPYYLQAFFFLIGTFSWLISETVFQVRLPFWTVLWGWSLVLTNMFALPLVNAVGLFLEESEEKDYTGLISFVILSYIVVPFQAYAALKGFIEKEEGGWFRTPKTGRITDVFSRGRFYRFIQGIMPGKTGAGQEVPMEISSADLYLSMTSANNPFNGFSIPRKTKRWVGKIAISTFMTIAILLMTYAPYIPSSNMRFEEKAGSGFILSPENKSSLLPLIKEVKAKDDGDFTTDRENGFEISAETKDFKSTDLPIFDLRIKTSLKDRLLINSKNLLANKSDKLVRSIKAKVIDVKGRERNVSLIKEDENIFSLSVNKEILTTPGEYELVIEDNFGKKITHDFTWGVLAINTNKSIYHTGETADLAFAVLDEEGKMVCDASLELSISNDQLSINEILSTKDGSIRVTPGCGSKEMLLTPDYEAEYKVGDVGIYELTLKANTAGGEFVIKDNFEVKDHVAFDVSRNTATRIYPKVDYPVFITVGVNDDYSGIVTEIVPNDFVISEISDNLDSWYRAINAESEFLGVKKSGGQQYVEWLVNWKKGNTYSIGYMYDAPNKSPEFYTLGPIQIGDFSEKRQWQIASDWVAEIPHASVFTDATDSTDYDDTAYHDIANASISHATLNTEGFDDTELVLIIADVNFEGSSVSYTQGIQIADTAGNAIANSTVLRRIRTADTRNEIVRIMVKTNKASGQGFVVQKASPFNATAYPIVWKVNMTVMGLGDLTANDDYVWGADTSSTTNLTTTPATFATITTPSGDSNWQGGVLVMDTWVGDNVSSTTTSLMHQLQRDSDSAVNITREEGNASDELYGGGSLYVFNNANTNAHTYNVQMFTSASAQFNHSYSAIIAFRASLFEDFEFANTNAELTPGDTNMNELAGITPFTPANSGDFFISGFAIAESNGATTDNVRTQLQLGGTNIPSGYTSSSEGTMLEDPDDLYPMNWASEETLAANSQDIDYDGASGASTIGWSYRTLVTFSFGLAPTGIDISGRIYTDEGSAALDCSTSRTVALSVNGGTPTTVECSNSPANGSYVFSSVTASAGNILTIFIDGETEKAVVITETAGTTMTGVDLYQNHVIVRHDNSGSLTIDDLNNYDGASDCGGGTGDTDIQFCAASGTPDTLTVDDGQKLFVWTGDEFAPGGTVTVDDIEIQGTYTAAIGESIFVSGSWDHSGTFTPSTSTVTFDAASGTEYIYTTGTGAFNNVVFNDSAGSATWNIEDPLDVDGNFTVTGGTVDVVNGENNQINIGGNWTNDDIFIERSGKVVFDTATAATLDSNCSDVTNCINENFYDLELSKSASGDTMTLTNFGIRVTNTLTLTNGTLEQGAYSVRAEGASAVSVGASGIWSNTSIGDLILGGSFANSGIVTFQGTTSTCGESDAISITSTSGGTQRSWTGAGTFNMNDVSVQDQGGTAAITVYSGTNVSGNNSNWVFSDCPITSTSSTATGYSFQRKTFYDDQNGTFWKLFHDGDEIDIKYSQDSGSSWTGITSLSYDTNDFSIWWSSISSIEYVWLAVTTSNDILVRRGTLTATSIAWDTEANVVALNGSDANDTYSYPYISLDSSNYMWVGGRHYDGTNYVYKSVRSDVNDTGDATWSGVGFGTTVAVTQLSTNQTNANVYGNIVPLASQDMYAVFVSNTALLGCIWDHSDSAWENSAGASCTGGGGASTFGIVNFGGFEGGDESPSAGDGGIDIYAWAKETGTGTGTINLVDIQGTVKRSGDYAFKFSDPSGTWEGDYFYVARPDRSIINESAVWLTMYLYPEAQPEAQTWISWFDGQCNGDLRWAADTWNINIDGSVGSTAVSLTQNTWNKVEFMIDCPGNTMSLSVNDGTAVTGVPHSGGTPGEIIQSVAIGPWNDFINGTFYIDDWVVSTSELTFNPKVVRMDVDGDGNSTDWDATNGYLEVDDVPADDDTTYITSSTATNKQLTSLESASSAGVSGLVEAVKTQALVRDEGGTSNLATVIRTNSTDYDRGEDNDPGAVYNSIGSTMETNPNTSATWSSSELDALQIGVLNNASVASRATAISTMVLTDPDTASGSKDSIDTVPNGLSKNLSAVVDPTNNDIHLLFVDDESTDQISYKRWDSGTLIWDSSATLVADAASANDAYATLSYDTDGSDLYAVWVDTSTNHIFYSSCDISTECNLASEWAAETDWHTETAPTNLTSNYSGGTSIFAMWTDGSGSPYNVEWDEIVVVPENLWLFFILGPILPALSKKKIFRKWISVWYRRFRRYMRSREKKT